MRLIPIARVLPGMRLGKSLLADDGKVLLGYHVELTQALIHKLRVMGFQQLYVEDARTNDIVVQDLLRDETLHAVKTALVRIFASLCSPGAFKNFSELQMFSKSASQCISLVMDDLRASHSHNDTIMLNRVVRLSTNLPEVFYQNAINVCVYAVKLGMISGLSYDELHTLGLGAMFHDIGITQIPHRLLLKSGSLSSPEFSEVQKHTEYGYKILKDTPGIPLLAAHCALQHHERIDGSGYPAGLKGDGIHPFAKWVAMLDGYDAMTNPRPYRPAHRPDQALEVLFAGAGTLYDIDKVELFRNKVAIYPVGLSVKLSTGEHGIVARIHSTYKHRPVVRILRNAQGEELTTPYEVDLSQNLHTMIHHIGEE
jgi:hypothetical protein